MPKVVLVTGGGRGIGAATAKLLAKRGYDVAVNYQSNITAAGKVVREIEGMGRRALAIQGDVAKEAHVVRMMSAVEERLGPLYGLVNNAALGTDGVLATMHNSQIEELVRVNTLSPLVLTKYVARAMMADGAGRIVNVASIVGFTGYSGLSVYAATKAAMLGFTRSLAREVGRLGITVNAVAPGFLDTEMTHGLAEEQRRKVVGRSALRRLAGVDDVANAVEYLLSDGARNISGTVLTIDAGATA